VTAPVENGQAGTPRIQQEMKRSPQGIGFPDHIDFGDHEIADASRVNIRSRAYVAISHQIFAGDQSHEVLVGVNHW
jgi:hypothetical protein